MYNTLTENDIQKMKDEIEYRTCELRHTLLEEVSRTRAYGDLSENFEYKEAKREKNKNESRIRYLQNMIKTAIVISDKSDENEIGLYDEVTVEIDDEEEVYTIVTNLRGNPLLGYITMDSPLGKALLGHKLGESVKVMVNETSHYFAKIIKIQKGEDDGSIPIRSY